MNVCRHLHKAEVLSFGLSQTAISVNDIHQRLRTHGVVERQRPVGLSVVTLEIHRQPGVAVAQAPGQDRFGHSAGRQRAE